MNQAEQPQPKENWAVSLTDSERGANWRESWQHYKLSLGGIDLSGKMGGCEMAIAFKATQEARGNVENVIKK